MERGLRPGLVLSLLVYGIAGAAAGRWVALASSLLVAVLLWRRYRRARFATYVFFTIVAIRGALTGSWWAFAYAVAAVLVLQTAAARRQWPRLTLGRRAAPDAAVADDRMRGS